MEIINLKNDAQCSDETMMCQLEPRNRGGKEKWQNEGLRITDIRQAVRSENRVNVFINGTYGFSLDVAQVVELKIKIGAKISAEKLEEYKKVSEYGKMYQRTLEWVLVRPRSVRETCDYLRKKVLERKMPAEFIDDIVTKLRDKGYLNDNKFARYYVENRFIKKGISARRIEMELLKKGVAKDIVVAAIGESERNDETEILKIIAKKRAKYDDEKMISYLCRQGFSFELARNLVRSYETD